MGAERIPEIQFTKIGAERILIYEFHKLSERMDIGFVHSNKIRTAQISDYGFVVKCSHPINETP